MIFGAGLFLFVMALFVSLAESPKKAGRVTASAGLLGLALMLASLCMLVARFMP
jgi:hypothetical protein